METAMSESPDPPPQSPDALFGQVYERLKLMAGRQLASGARSVTLDTTVLVHELYLRIHAQGDLAFAYPGQFFSYAARAMRHLLTDRARVRASMRAGGDWVQITLTAHDHSFALASAEEAIALDAALSRLAAVDERAAQVVELRYFAGLTSEQTADALAISKRTADRDWTFAMAFMKADLG
jgi:RNA polymerase sigma factor (TIGR02999 family)